MNIYNYFIIAQHIVATLTRHILQGISFSKGLIFLLWVRASEEVRRNSELNLIVKLRIQMGLYNLY